MNSNKIAHLKMIQDCINRMARNSFLIKGWIITLVISLITFFEPRNNIYIEYLILIPIIIFYLMDTYYLLIEKAFRKLYNQVRDLNEEDVNFSMNIEEFKRKEFINALKSIPNIVFYLTLIILLTLFIIFR